MARKFPILRSEEEAEAFLEQDLADSIPAENFAAYPYEFRPKEKSLNLRISEGLLDAVRERARQEGIPCQRSIRQALETALSRPAAGPAKKRRAAG